MTDFLLELRCEEIPARMQAGARAELEKLFAAQMEAAGLEAASISVWSTPRRLALIATNLPDETQAVREEAKGPPQGAPDQAVDGFCRKNNVTRDRLEVREVKGRATYFAVIDTPGRRTADVLAEAVPAIVRGFSWPKSMRWGEASASTESLRWVRPLSGIVALFGADVVPFEIGGIASGRDTVGHRFHFSGGIAIHSAADYADSLRGGHVIVDQEERAAIIRDGAKMAAQAAGLTLVEDEGLVVENAGLTEWPVPQLGWFDEAYLAVPPEVIQLTARVNQKYFVCEDANGTLANAFVCTANIHATDGGQAVVAGNEKVLAARLSDARFFWELDRKKTLEQHAEGLERITFHEKLGTVADKVERVAKLAEWLASEGIVPDCDPKLARQAAQLCKADLVTEMVGEFPELQGLMGGYYARAEGLPPQVADAIRDHYKPVGQGDEVPTAPVTVAVSLADKLDTIDHFFLIDAMPTGSKDPFALRRAALGIVRLLRENDLRLSIFFGTLQNLMSRSVSEEIRDSQSQAINVLNELIDQLGPEAAMGALQGWARSEKPPTLEKQIKDTVSKQMLAAMPVCGAVRDFFLERMEVIERGAGTPVGIVRAALSYDGGREDDLVRLLARVKALQTFVETEDGTNLLAGYKRAANILKKEDYSAPGEDPESRAAKPPSTPGSALGSASSAEHANDDIPHTGEEDPLSQVDDPDVAAAVQAKIAEAKKETAHKPLSYTPEKAEKALIDALAAAGPQAAAAVEAEDFAGAMAALAALRAPIDGFFDSVTVNDADGNKRAARLALLARFRDAVHRVADFSKIEG